MTGFNPVGLGAGTHLGRYITQELKPGPATE